MKKIILCVCLVIVVMFCGCSNSSSTINDIEENINEEITSDDVTIEQNDEGKDEAEEIVVAEPTDFMIKEEPIQQLSEGQIGIYTLDDLKNISELDENHYVLMADIDCEGEKLNIVWFKGKFDGNFHQIKNVSSPVFDSVYGAEIKNLAVVNSTSNAGGIINVFRDGSIYNCYITGEIGKNSNGEIVGENIGGIVGEITSINCDISFCYNCADVYGKYSDVGGIVGEIENDESKSSNPINIAYCENYGDIYLLSDKVGGNIGGICGGMFFDKSEIGYNGSFNISKCMNYGKISLVGDECKSSVLGGIVGSVGTKTQAENSTLNVIVSQSANYGKVGEGKLQKGLAGGLCGAASNWNNDYTNVEIAFISCLNASVNEVPLVDEIDAYKGAITFRNSINLAQRYKPLYENQITKNGKDGTVKIEECYYLNIGDSSAHKNQQESTALSETDMRNKDNFPSFDWGYTWNMSDDYNDGYPYIMNHAQYTEYISQIDYEVEY